MELALAPEGTGRRDEGIALALSAVAGDHGQAYFHAVNVAFLELVRRRDRSSAMTAPSRVLEHCAAAHPSSPPEGDLEGRLHEVFGFMPAASMGPARHGEMSGA